MEWDFLYVLHNLVLPTDSQATDAVEGPEELDLGTSLMAITGGNDPRVRNLRETNPVVDQIMKSFRNERGKVYSPAVLIVRRNAPDTARSNEEAIVAFRNAAALGIILKGRAAAVRGYGGLGPTWADTFDFHPAQVSKGGRMVLISPAHQSLIATNHDLNLTPSAHVPVEGRHLWPDRYIHRTLGEEWLRRYVDPGTDDQFGRSLFRSLEVAYTACGVGGKNQESIHDYGLQVALWVSAIEILAWPQSGHANFDIVLSLLGRAELPRNLALRRYQAKVGRSGNRRRLNALERGYSYLYKARNSFLHGNPVGPTTLFTRGKDPVAIPRIAAVVYRIALASYLSERYPLETATLEELSENLAEWLDQTTYQEALAEIFSVDV